MGWRTDAMIDSHKSAFSQICVDATAQKPVRQSAMCSADVRGLYSLQIATSMALAPRSRFLMLSSSPVLCGQTVAAEHVPWLLNACVFSCSVRHAERQIFVS